MKKTFLFAIPTFFLMSCGGDETSTSNENTSESVDTSSVDSVIVQTLTFNDFAEKCNELPAKEVGSLDSVLLWYGNSKEGFTQEEKDSSLLLYVEQMYKLLGYVDGEYDQEEEFKELYEPYGFNIGGGEGMLWLIADTEKAAKKFEGDLSQDLREYMRLGEITGKQYSADAGMIISYTEWGNMLIDLEDRIRENRESKYYQRFLEAYRSYLRWYMWGMDNTPITRWDDQPGLNDEVKAAYEKIIADEDHRTGAIVRAHWFDLEMSGEYYRSWDDQWVPSFEEIEHYFYDELEVAE